MPGRSRTGSSPSRTVMSLAVYVASLIEKALQTGRLRALRILPEPAVGFRSREAQRRRLCNDFAKVLVVDPGDETGRLFEVFRCGVRPRPGSPFRVGRSARQRSLDEPQARRRVLAERCPDPRFEVRELERPRGRTRVDAQCPVAAEP